MLVPFRTTAASRRILRSVAVEDGLTLIELLVAAALSIIVLGGVLSVLVSSQNVQARDNEWAQMIQEARTSLATMTHEIRQAYKIVSTETSHTQITFYETIAGKSWEVQYNCAETQPETNGEYDECVRKAALFVTEGGKEVPPATLPATGAPVIKYVINGSEDPILQELLPNAVTPDLVKIQLIVPAKGTLKLPSAEAYKHHVVLSDAAYIRNMALGS